MRSWLLSLAAVAVGTACSQTKPAPPPAPKVIHDTVTVTTRDPELDKRATRLELQLLARDAQIEDLQSRLDDTRAEVVRAMAKLQTVASRAQAASAMAEAEVALQTMKSGAAGEPIWRLSRESSRPIHVFRIGIASGDRIQANIADMSVAPKLDSTVERVDAENLARAIRSILREHSGGTIEGAELSIHELPPLPA